MAFGPEPYSLHGVEAITATARERPWILEIVCHDGQGNEVPMVLFMNRKMGRYAAEIARAINGISDDFGLIPDGLREEMAAEHMLAEPALLAVE